MASIWAGKSITSWIDWTWSVISVCGTHNLTTRNCQRRGAYTSWGNLVSLATGQWWYAWYYTKIEHFGASTKYLLFTFFASLRNQVSWVFLTFYSKVSLLGLNFILFQNPGSVWEYLTKYITPLRSLGNQSPTSRHDHESSTGVTMLHTIEPWHHVWEQYQRVHRVTSDLNFCLTRIITVILILGNQWIDTLERISRLVTAGCLTSRSNMET